MRPVAIYRTVKNLPSREIRHKEMRHKGCDSDYLPTGPRGARRHKVSPGFTKKKIVRSALQSCALPILVQSTRVHPRIAQAEREE